MKKFNSWLVGIPLFLTSIAITGRWLLLTVANAQTQSPPVTVESKEELSNLICSFIIYFFWIVIVISVIMVLVAAFDYVTAGDDTEKTTRGRKRLTYAAVGIAIALLATGFPAIISSVFPQNPNANIGDACSIL